MSVETTGATAPQSALTWAIAAGVTANTTIPAKRLFGVGVTASGSNAPSILDCNNANNTTGCTNIAPVAASAAVGYYAFNAKLNTGAWTVVGNASNPALTIYYA